MPQQTGWCIFCGGRGLTKEHVWPKWLRGVLDPSITTPRHFYSTSGFGRRRTFTHRAGTIESRRLRIVCERRNTGWMSRLQNNARSRLLPLIRGQHISLTEANYKIVAAWSMMFTMVIEFFDLTTLATPQRERMEFARADHRSRYNLENGPPSDQRGDLIAAVAHEEHPRWPPSSYAPVECGYGHFPEA